ncbi:MAG TPA: metallophosphoesterase family protein [Thermomicrobiales bacterium]|nr:metallophosphoesterase family protein [Thermomicrobiales bacterium]
MVRMIAVITDVHANLPALEAALSEIDALGCDEIVHTGDAIGIGPFPAETLDRLLARPRIRFAMGNHDAWFSLGLPDNAPEWMDEGERRHHEWVHAQLPDDLRTVVESWPWAHTDEFRGVRALFTHYGHPDGHGGFAPIRRDPTGRDLDEVFGDAEVDVVFYGHHHPRCDLTGRARYINPGSLGCHTEPVARFAVLEVERDGAWSVAFHQAPYDPTPVLEALEARDVPDRELIRKGFLRFDM